MNKKNNWEENFQKKWTKIDLEKVKKKGAQKLPFSRLIQHNINKTVKKHE